MIAAMFAVSAPAVYAEEGPSDSATPTRAAIAASHIDESPSDNTPGPERRGGGGGSSLRKKRERMALMIQYRDLLVQYLELLRARAEA